MTAKLAFDVRAVLLDIEGTIGSQSYVAEVMFPYARKHLAEFVASHRDTADVKAALEETAALAGCGSEPVTTLIQWIDEDRKAPPLKKLQGLIWDAGFRDGSLKGHIYKDALDSLTAWHNRKIPLYIYSSGSVKAQNQFYQYNEAGDLRYLFSGHYDTEIGAKVESASYGRIAEDIGVEPAKLLFLTDNVRECEAARDAGLPVVQVVREKTEPSDAFPVIHDFSALSVTLDGQ